MVGARHIVTQVVGLGLGVGVSSALLWDNPAFTHWVATRGQHGLSGILFIAVVVALALFPGRPLPLSGSTRDTVWAIVFAMPRGLAIGLLGVLLIYGQYWNRYYFDAFFLSALVLASSVDAVFRIRQKVLGVLLRGWIRIFPQRFLSTIHAVVARKQAGGPGQRCWRLLDLSLGRFPWPAAVHHAIALELDRTSRLLARSIHRATAPQSLRQARRAAVLAELEVASWLSDQRSMSIDRAASIVERFAESTLLLYHAECLQAKVELGSVPVEIRRVGAGVVELLASVEQKSAALCLDRVLELINSLIDEPQSVSSDIDKLAEFRDALGGSAGQFLGTVLTLCRGLAQWQLVSMQYFSHAMDIASSELAVYSPVSQSSAGFDAGAAWAWATTGRCRAVVDESSVQAADKLTFQWLQGWARRCSAPGELISSPTDQALRDKVRQIGGPWLPWVLPGRVLWLSASWCAVVVGLVVAGLAFGLWSASQTTLAGAVPTITDHLRDDGDQIGGVRIFGVDCAPDSDELLMATEGQGLQVVDTNSFYKHTERSVTGGPQFDLLHDVHVDVDGNAIVEVVGPSGHHGVDTRDRSGQWKQLVSGSVIPEIDSETELQDVARIDENRVVLGTSDAVLVYDESARSLASVNISPLRAEDVQDVEVVGGALWVSTTNGVFSGVVAEIDSGKQFLKQVYTAEPGDQVDQILAYESQFLIRTRAGMLWSVDSTGNPRLSLGGEQWPVGRQSVDFLTTDATHSVLLRVIRQGDMWVAGLRREGEGYWRVTPEFDVPVDFDRGVAIAPDGSVALLVLRGGSVLRLEPSQDDQRRLDIVELNSYAQCVSLDAESDGFVALFGDDRGWVIRDGGWPSARSATSCDEFAHRARLLATGLSGAIVHAAAHPTDDTVFLLDSAGNCIEYGLQSRGPVGQAAVGLADRDGNPLPEVVSMSVVGGSLQVLDSMQRRHDFSIPLQETADGWVSARSSKAFGRRAAGRSVDACWDIGSLAIGIIDSAGEAWTWSQSEGWLADASDLQIRPKTIHRTPEGPIVGLSTDGKLVWHEKERWREQGIGGLEDFVPTDSGIAVRSAQGQIDWLEGPVDAIATVLRPASFGTGGLSPPIRDISALGTGGDKSLLCVDERGLVRYMPKTREWERIEFNHSLPRQWKLISSGSRVFLWMPHDGLLKEIEGTGQVVNHAHDVLDVSGNGESIAFVKSDHSVYLIGEHGDPRLMVEASSDELDGSKLGDAAPWKGGLFAITNKGPAFVDESGRVTLDKLPVDGAMPVRMRILGNHILIRDSFDDVWVRRPWGWAKVASGIVNMYGFGNDAMLLGELGKVVRLDETGTAHSIVAGGFKDKLRFYIKDNAPVIEINGALMIGTSEGLMKWSGVNARPQLALEVEGGLDAVLVGGREGYMSGPNSTVQVDALGRALIVRPRRADQVVNIDGSDYLIEDGKLVEVDGTGDLFGGGMRVEDVVAVHGPSSAKIVILRDGVWGKYLPGTLRSGGKIQGLASGGIRQVLPLNANQSLLLSGAKGNSTVHVVSTSTGEVIGKPVDNVVSIGAADGNAWCIARMPANAGSRLAMRKWTGSLWSQQKSQTSEAPDQVVACLLQGDRLVLLDVQGRMWSSQDGDRIRPISQGFRVVDGLMRQTADGSIVVNASEGSAMLSPGKPAVSMVEGSGKWATTHGDELVVYDTDSVNTRHSEFQFEPYGGQSPQSIVNDGDTIYVLDIRGHVFSYQVTTGQWSTVGGAVGPGNPGDRLEKTADGVVLIGATGFRSVAGAPVFHPTRGSAVTAIEKDGTRSLYWIDPTTRQLQSDSSGAMIPEWLAARRVAVSPDQLSQYRYVKGQGRNNDVLIGLGKAWVTGEAGVAQPHQIPLGVVSVVAQPDSFGWWAVTLDGRVVSIRSNQSVVLNGRVDPGGALLGVVGSMLVFERDGGCIDVYELSDSAVDRVKIDRGMAVWCDSQVAVYECGENDPQLAGVKVFVATDGSAKICHDGEYYSVPADRWPAPPLKIEKIEVNEFGSKGLVNLVATFASGDQGTVFWSLQRPDDFEVIDVPFAFCQVSARPSDEGELLSVFLSDRGRDGGVPADLTPPSELNVVSEPGEWLQWSRWTRNDVSMTSGLLRGDQPDKLYQSAAGHPLVSLSHGDLVYDLDTGLLKSREQIVLADRSHLTPPMSMSDEYDRLTWTDTEGTKVVLGQLVPGNPLQADQIRDDFGSALGDASTTLYVDVGGTLWSRNNQDGLRRPIGQASSTDAVLVSQHDRKEKLIIGARGFTPLKEGAMLTGRSILEPCLAKGARSDGLSWRHDSGVVRFQKRDEFGVYPAQLAGGWFSDDWPVEIGTITEGLAGRIRAGRDDRAVNLSTGELMGKWAPLAAPSPSPVEMEFGRMVFDGSRWQPELRMSSGEFLRVETDANGGFSFDRIRSAVAAGGEYFLLTDHPSVIRRGIRRPRFEVLPGSPNRLDSHGDKPLAVADRTLFSAAEAYERLPNGTWRKTEPSVSPPRWVQRGQSRTGMKGGPSGEGFRVGDLEVKWDVKDGNFNFAIADLKADTDASEYFALRAEQSAGWIIHTEAGKVLVGDSGQGVRAATEDGEPPPSLARLENGRFWVDRDDRERPVIGVNGVIGSLGEPSDELEWKIDKGFLSGLDPQKVVPTGPNSVALVSDKFLWFSDADNACKPLALPGPRVDALPLADGGVLTRVGGIVRQSTGGGWEVAGDSLWREMSRGQKVGLGRWSDQKGIRWSRPQGFVRIEIESIDGTWHSIGIDSRGFTADNTDAMAYSNGQLFVEDSGALLAIDSRDGLLSGWFAASCNGNLTQAMSAQGRQIVGMQEERGFRAIIDRVGTLQKVEIAKYGYARCHDPDLSDSPDVPMYQLIRSSPEASAWRHRVVDGSATDPMFVDMQEQDGLVEWQSPWAILGIEDDESGLVMMGKSHLVATYEGRITDLIPLDLPTAQHLAFDGGVIRWAGGSVPIEGGKFGEPSSADTRVDLGIQTEAWSVAALSDDSLVLNSKSGGEQPLYLRNRVLPGDLPLAAFRLEGKIVLALDGEMRVMGANGDVSFAGDLPIAPSNSGVSVYRRGDCGELLVGKDSIRVIESGGIVGTVAAGPCDDEVSFDEYVLGGTPLAYELHAAGLDDAAVGWRCGSLPSDWSAGIGKRDDGALVVLDAAGPTFLEDGNESRMHWPEDWGAPASGEVRRFTDDGALALVRGQTSYAVRGGDSLEQSRLPVHKDVVVDLKWELRLKDGSTAVQVKARDFESVHGDVFQNGRLRFDHVVDTFETVDGVGVVTAHGIELLGNDGMLHPVPAAGDAIEALSTWTNGHYVISRTNDELLLDGKPVAKIAQEDELFVQNGRFWIVSPDSVRWLRLNEKWLR